MNIKELSHSEMPPTESEIASDSTDGNRKLWVTAQEIAGLDGMPTTDRRVRDLLEQWAIGLSGVKRKRKGTKAFEYHISILPKDVADVLAPGEHENQTPCNTDKGTGFPERLHSLIGEGNGRKFSRETGISYSKLHNYLSGASLPTLDSLIDLSKATGTSIEWLATGISPAGQQPGHVPPNVRECVDEWSEFALIPGYRVQVSAGHGAIAPDGEEPCRYLAFRRKWLKWRGFSEKDLVIVWCKGESMEPAIYNNDTLVVHTGQTKPVDGGVYVLRNHDQLWVKRIQSLPNAWVLLSDNPRYPPIEVPKDEQHNFQVVGKVVHIAHDVD